MIAAVPRSEWVSVPDDPTTCGIQTLVAAPAELNYNRTLRTVIDRKWLPNAQCQLRSQTACEWGSHDVAYTNRTAFGGTSFRWLHLRS